MKKRCFAFGCSYTSYSYATWADLIGINFEEYYNFGLAGSSNTHMMNKLVEANEIHKFNPETDYVLVMLTGFGRFTYLPPLSSWQAKGDLYAYNHNTNDAVTVEFVKNMWSDNWAVYQSWIAAKVIKQTLKGINHAMVMGIDNSGYIDGTADLHNSVVPLAQEIYDILDVSITLDKWKEKNQYTDSPFWVEEERRDGHPSTDVYLKYVREFFPQYNTEKTNNLVEYWKENFDHRSQYHMGRKFENDFRRRYDLAQNII